MSCPIIALRPPRLCKWLSSATLHWLQGNLTSPHRELRLPVFLTYCLPSLERRAVKDWWCFKVVFKNFFPFCFILYLVLTFALQFSLQYQSQTIPTTFTGRASSLDKLIVLYFVCLNEQTWNCPFIKPESRRMQMWAVRSIVINIHTECIPRFPLNISSITSSQCLVCSIYISTWHLV